MQLTNKQRPQYRLAASYPSTVCTQVGFLDRFAEFLLTRPYGLPLLAVVHEFDQYPPATELVTTASQPLWNLQVVLRCL